MALVCALSRLRPVPLLVRATPFSRQTTWLAMANFLGVIRSVFAIRRVSTSALARRP